MDKRAEIVELQAKLREHTFRNLDAFEDGHSGKVTPKSETLSALADIMEEPVLELQREWHRATNGAAVPEEIAKHLRETKALCEALRRAAASAKDFEAAGMKSPIQNMRERRDGGPKKAQAVAQLQKRTRKHIEKALAKEPDLTRAAIFERANAFLEARREKARDKQTLTRREWLRDLLPEGKTGPKRR